MYVCHIGLPKTLGAYIGVYRPGLSLMSAACVHSYRFIPVFNFLFRLFLYVYLFYIAVIITIIITDVDRVLSIGQQSSPPAHSSHTHKSFYPPPPAGWRHNGHAPSNSIIGVRKYVICSQHLGLISLTPVSQLGVKNSCASGCRPSLKNRRLYNFLLDP